MTLEEARIAVGGALIRDKDQEWECFYVQPATAPSGLALMITEGRVARIDVFSPKYVTVSGSKVGFGQEKTQQLYGGRLKLTVHQYNKTGRYLTFVPDSATDAAYRMVFETDGRHVTQIRAGKMPEVAWVEGCS